MSRPSKKQVMEFTELIAYNVLMTPARDFAGGTNASHRMIRLLPEKQRQEFFYDQTQALKLREIAFLKLSVRYLSHDFPQHTVCKK